MFIRYVDLLLFIYIYLVDFVAIETIQVYSQHMEVTTIIGNTQSGTIDGIGITAQLDTPNQVCVDGYRNVMYIATGGSIRRVNMTTLATSTIGLTYAFINSVTSCSIKSTGDLYVTTTSQLTLILLSNQQNVIELAGDPGSCKSNSLIVECRLTNSYYSR